MSILCQTVLLFGSEAQTHQICPQGDQTKVNSFPSYTSYTRCNLLSNIGQWVSRPTYSRIYNTIGCLADFTVYMQLFQLYNRLYESTILNSPSLTSNSLSCIQTCNLVVPPVGWTLQKSSVPWPIMIRDHWRGIANENINVGLGR